MVSDETPLTVEKRRAEIAPSLLGLLVFASFGIMLIILCIHIVLDTGIESGDFAANSILIQYAKHFKLTIGNYSRVGFNHPGPAIIYVLAAGEFFMHDWLGWVTPVGGQIIAALTYNAFWLGLSATLLRRMCVRTIRALIIICIIVAIMAIKQPRSFDALWFPYLYVMPFLAFLIALAAVAWGDRPAWLALAFSAGFLTNGHVSFFAICGIAIVLVGSYAWATKLRWRVAWPMWAAFIFALFCVPLALRELRHRPGPIEQYAYFAGQNIGHSLIDSLQFIGHHVGATALEVAVVFVAGVSLVQSRHDSFQRAMAIAVCGVTIATLYYVVRGVDDLTYDYVIMFFDVVPASILGIAGFEALRCTQSRWVPFAAMAASLAVWGGNIYKDVPIPGYNQPEIAIIDRDLGGLGPERIALILNTSHDWNKIWPDIVGVESRRLRDGRPIGFCIAENWHVLFTDTVKCGPSDAANRRITVDTVGASHSKELVPVLTSGGLEFLADRPRCLAAGSTMTVLDNPIASAQATGEGWSALEKSFVWSLGHHSFLKLCVDDDVRSVSVDLHAFLPNATFRQRVSARVGSEPTVDVVFGSDKPAQWIRVPIPPDHKRQVTLNFDFPDATSPADAGVSGDARVLAVSLIAVKAD